MICNRRQTTEAQRHRALTEGITPFVHASLHPSFPNSVWERMPSNPRSQTLFGNACPRTLVPKLCLGTHAFEPSFPNSVWERMPSKFCFESTPRRETEFRRPAFPNRSLGTREQETNHRGTENSQRGTTPYPRSHALRGNARWDALRPVWHTVVTQSVEACVPTQSVGTRIKGKRYVTCPTPPVPPPST
jgi:hypothetical protein